METEQKGKYWIRLGKLSLVLTVIYLLSYFYTLFQTKKLDIRFESQLSKISYPTNMFDTTAFKDLELSDFDSLSTLSENAILEDFLSSDMYLIKLLLLIKKN